MTGLALAAPLAGWATRLAEVPDPAFAQGLVGDGVAIDPTSSELRAPCDGVVASVHRARHACTLRADGGAEILLHVGIDTVALRGEGFRVLVADGQRVRTGDPLIRFDPDLVLRKAKSLHTLVLLVGGDGLAVVERVTDREVEAGDFLLAIAPAEPRVAAERPGIAAQPSSPASFPSPSGTSGAPAAAATRSGVLSIRDGLHARPAAAFARRARQHAGAVTVACGRRSANGKSMVALMALDARLGDAIAITVDGPGAEAVVGELAALVAAGLGDVPATASRPRGTPGDPDNVVSFAPGEPVVLAGAPAVAGLASGRAVRLADLGTGPEVVRDGAGAAAEKPRLTAALAEVRRDIEQAVGGAAARGDAAAGDIFRAHLELLEDPELAAAAGREIAAGRSAAWAWRAALGELAGVLRGLGNPLLAERTADLVDLERRTLAELAGGRGRVPAELPEGAVLIADELMPSELAAVPAGRLAGLATAGGGATSHVAILAAGLGVPAVVALGDAVRRVPDGAPVIVDGDAGALHVFPAPATRDAALRAITGRAARRKAQQAAAHEPARTTDGVAIAVYANLAGAGDAAAAVAAGAEGCGLLRTEFAFFDRADRHSPPSEDEQVRCYQAIADALQGRPLVIRTLDAGADKPLPYLPSAREDNPALGVRGVRLTLRHPEILRAQLRAILRVVSSGPAGACRIMVPMIASLAELRAVRGMLDDERRALGIAAPAVLGAMIEVPAAALIAETLARDVDFLSIGTNDLAQYALAIDRTSRALAAELDGLHPGVLRLIASTASGAAAHGRPLSVCGGAAADPYAVPLLLGLGVRTLSVAPAQVPEIKAIVRTLSLAACRDTAAAALQLASGGDVRALVATTWPGLAADHDSSRSFRS